MGAGPGLDGESRPRLSVGTLVALLADDEADEADEEVGEEDALGKRAACLTHDQNRSNLPPSRATLPPPPPPPPPPPSPLPLPLEGGEGDAEDELLDDKEEEEDANDDDAAAAVGNVAISSAGSTQYAEPCRSLYRLSYASMHCCTQDRNRAKIFNPDANMKQLEYRSRSRMTRLASSSFSFWSPSIHRSMDSASRLMRWYTITGLT